MECRVGLTVEEGVMMTTIKPTTIPFGGVGKGDGDCDSNSDGNNDNGSGNAFNN